MSECFRSGSLNVGKKASQRLAMSILEAFGFDEEERLMVGVIETRP